MVTRPRTQENLALAVQTYLANERNYTKGAEALGWDRMTFKRHVEEAAKKGMLGTDPVMPGFRISKVSTTQDGDGNTLRSHVQQKPEIGGQFNVPEGHKIKGVSALLDGHGNVQGQWIKTREGDLDPGWLTEQIREGLRDDLPLATPTPAPQSPLNSDLLNCFILTDYHLGMLADRDETGSDDWDLKIAEDLLIKWFEVAIHKSPDAETAILGQLGDFMHYDSMETVTPAHRHVLDADSRPQKIIRVAIRVMRTVVRMLLEKHSQVHLIVADANHDPLSSAWQREFWAMHYEEEPRLSVDTSADTYYAYEFGQTSLFFHHGHKRGLKNIDHVFAGKFRDIYGRTKHSFGHIGHLHQYAAQESNLMVIEQHPTLAPEDSFASKGGWTHKRNAKVLTYHRHYGEVSRDIISPEMVMSLTAAA